MQSKDEQIKTFGSELYDLTRWSWPGMFAYLANDGQHKQKGNRCNSTIQEHGHLQATKAIPCLEVDQPNWHQSEILWPYGQHYWS